MFCEQVTMGSGPQSLTVSNEDVMGWTSSLGGRKQVMQTELSWEIPCPARGTTLHTEWFTLHHTFIRKTTVFQENCIIELFNGN
jgi:hypothetical protein